MKTVSFEKSLLILFMILFSIVLLSNSAQAESAIVIDVKVNEALDKFQKEVESANELVSKSLGILVFPSVIKAGIGIGGEYGEGALRINGKTVDYYNTATVSIGFQLGAQAKTVILLFMTNEVLSKFRNSKGWEVGIDGSVALIKVGVGGSLDTTKIKEPILGFVIGQKGLMYNLTLEGSKITKLNK